jgi:hypothetical protein
MELLHAEPIVALDHVNGLVLGPRFEVVEDPRPAVDDVHLELAVDNPPSKNVSILDPHLTADTGWDEAWLPETLPSPAVSTSLIVDRLPSPTRKLSVLVHKKKSLRRRLRRRSWR